MRQENVSRILDFWEAYDRVNALPDPWMQTATICQQIAVGNSIAVRSAGEDVTHLPKPDDFMPPRWIPPVRPVVQNVLTDEELAKRLDDRFRNK